MRSSTFFFTALCLGTMVWVVLTATEPAAAEDKENCLMCHKYKYLGRISEEGRKHTYHVPESIYAKSIHRNVPCRNCHTTITKIPHDPVTEPVNCASLCHVKPPHADKKFSHEEIIEIYDDSVHGIEPDDPLQLKESQPNCKFCHLNPIYTRLGQDLVDYDKTLKRCLNCHQKKGVTQAYVHVTHRLRKKTSRSPREIVQLCAKCHQDKEMMKKLDVSEDVLLAVETYNRSIHGKSVMLGSDETADCISCHASSKLHDIYKKENEKATINKDNIQATCKQCHEQTNSWFVRIAVHPRIEKEKDPVVYFASIFFRLALYGSLFSMVGLMLLETYGRKKEGIKVMLRRGTTWRGKPKPR